MTARARPSDRKQPRGALRRGAHILIRFPVPSDEAEFCELRARSAKRLRPWEPKPPPGARGTPSEWFGRLLSYRRTETHRKLLICLVEDGTIVGGVSLNEIVRGAMDGCFAGWWIGDPYEGRGYMREAIALLLDHAFLDVGLHRVEANIRPENERSRSLARRLGFRCEGYSPRYLQIGGKWCDHERWAILSDEWKAHRG